MFCDLVAHDTGRMPRSSSSNDSLDISLSTIPENGPTDFWKGQTPRTSSAFSNTSFDSSVSTIPDDAAASHENDHMSHTSLAIPDVSLDTTTFGGEYDPINDTNTVDDVFLTDKVPHVLAFAFDSFMVCLEFPCKKNGWSYRADLGGPSQHRWDFRSTSFTVTRSRCEKANLPRKTCRNCIMKKTWRRQCSNPEYKFYLHARLNQRSSMDDLRALNGKCTHPSKRDMQLYSMKAAKLIISPASQSCSRDKLHFLKTFVRSMFNLPIEQDADHSSQDLLYRVVASENNDFSVNFVNEQLDEQVLVSPSKPLTDSPIVDDKGQVELRALFEHLYDVLSRHFSPVDRRLHVSPADVSTLRTLIDACPDSRRQLVRDSHMSCCNPFISTKSVGQFVFCLDRDALALYMDNWIRNQSGDSSVVTFAIPPDETSYIRALSRGVVDIGTLMVRDESSALRACRPNVRPVVVIDSSTFAYQHNNTLLPLGAFVI